MRAVALFIIVIITSCSPNSDFPNFRDVSQSSNGDAYVSPEPVYAGHEITLIHSTVQTDRSSAECAEGWGWLVDQLSQKDQGHLPPIQPKYVDQFESLPEMQDALIDAGREFEDIMPVIRVSLVWSCWMQADGVWKEQMLTLLNALESAGIRYEIALEHHGSYPRELIDTRAVGAMHGWAHERAVPAFVAYTTDVVNAMKDRLEPGARITLIHEPMLPLFKGYLWGQNWPPGQRFAQKSLVASLQNTADGMLEGGRIVAEAGFVPMVGKNIRPVTIQPEDKQPGKTLDRLVNWSLTDMLYRGCVDRNLDGIDDIMATPCGEVRRDSPFTRAGVTFYGSMTVGSDAPMSIHVDSETELVIGVGVEDPQSDPEKFSEAIQSVLDRYPWMMIDISEIGFSAPPTLYKHLSWWKEYLDVCDTIGPRLGSIGVHSIFLSAEFTSGDHFFHLVTGCGDRFCERTQWGKDFMRELLTRYVR